MPAATSRRRPLVAPFLCLFAAALIAAAIIVLPSTPADAADDITISFDEIVRSSAGSQVLIQEVSVPADLVGAACTMSVDAENQSSVHLGNDLIVTTGTSQAVIVGVEDTANAATNRAYDMRLGTVIRVDMRIGGDGMSSLGFELVFDCIAPTEPTVAETPVIERTTVAPPRIETGTVTAPPTTTPPTTAPVTSPPTTAVPSTTAAPVEAAPQQPAALPRTPTAQAITAAPAYTG